MVRSAAKLVSKTLSKPSRRSAATILPSALVPMGMPKASPMVTRVAGAVWTRTTFSGSPRASQTSFVWSFSVRAPVGQATMHWPQETQEVSPSGVSKAQEMLVAKPRSLAPMTPTSCHLRQTAVQRRQRMHLLLSRIMWGAEVSSSYSLRAPLKASTSSTP